MGQAEASFTISNGGVISSSNYVDTGNLTGGCGTVITPTTWTTCYSGCYHIDKTRQAFQIIQILVDRKMIKLTSVKKFMELVDEIYKVL